MMDARTYETYISEIFQSLKYNRPSITSPIFPVLKSENRSISKVIAILSVLTKNTLEDQKTIRLLAHWRKKNAKWFPSQFRVTYKGTKRWTQTELLEKKDRILFILFDLENIPLGHLGLYRFNYKQQVCEVDNIIRGIQKHPYIMTYALNSLCQWAFTKLQLKALQLRVFADNKRAINLYTRVGFDIVEKIPLIKITDKHALYWKELPTTEVQKGQRFFIRMEKKLK